MISSVHNANGGALPVANRVAGRMRMMTLARVNARRGGAMPTILLLLQLLTGCNSSDGDSDGPFGSPRAVVKEEQKDSLSLKLVAASDDLGLSDRLQIRAELEAPSDVTISPIAYQTRLGEGDRSFEYSVTPTREDLAVPLGDGRLRWTLDFELDFFLPGDYDLPALEVQYVQITTSDASREPADSPEIQTLSTEGISVLVRAPADGALTEEELARVERLDPVELAPEKTAWSWILPVAIALLIVIIVFLIRRSRTAAEHKMVIIPAHLWAKRELDELAREDLVGRGLVQDYYYRISGIVRGYIERRFGVSAPEMTTEEFLAAASRDRRFGSDITEELDRFLVACDLVKYARQIPGLSEAGSVMNAAGEFVERTHQPEELSGSTQQPGSQSEGEAA